MAKKFESVEIKTAAGKVSEARGVNAGDEVVTLGKAKIPVADAITSYVNALSVMKTAEEEKDKQANIIRTFVGDIRTYFRKKADHSKTYRIFGKVAGSIQYALDVIMMDKWSVPKKNEDWETLKKEVTASVFNQLFEEIQVIKIKKIITDNDQKRRELTKKLVSFFGEDGIKEYFEKETSYEVKAGLAETLPKMSEEVQASVLKHLTQSSDMIKDATGEAV